jgi:hypothetical protein
MDLHLVDVMGSHLVQPQFERFHYGVFVQHTYAYWGGIYTEKIYAQRERICLITYMPQYTVCTYMDLHLVDVMGSHLVQPQFERLHDPLDMRPDPGTADFKGSFLIPRIG